MKPTLSLCMIVKDEEKLLASCLNSVKDVVNQMVIVDTGSMDDTINIAKDFGAEVYKFPWTDHFAEARNESIKYATGDWILWMDADETLDPESISELTDRIKERNKNVFCSIRITSRNKYENKVIYSEAHRLFPNGLGIHFENRIHEQISRSAKNAGLQEVITGIHIIHEGYNLTEEEYHKKLLRNLPLLKKMADENKHDSYAHYTLAQNYSGLKKYEEAVKHFKIALATTSLGNSLKMNILNVMSQAYSHLGEWELSKKYSLQSIEINPIQSGAFYMLYKCAEQDNDIKQAIEYLNILLQNTKKLNANPQSVGRDILISEQKIIKILGNSYAKIGNRKKSLELFSTLEEKEMSKPLLLKIIQLPENESEWKLLIIILQNILSHNKYAEVEIYDILGQTYIKTNQIQKALDLYLKLYDDDEFNKIVLKRIAALYAKLGDIKKAEYFIAKMNKLN